MKSRFAEFLLPLLFALFSTHWLGWADGIGFLQATDVASYEKFAAAFPGWPGSQIPLHHAQRFLVHYFVGGLSWLTGAPLLFAYRLALGACVLAILLSLRSLLESLGLARRWRFLFLGLFILNPYTLRYYWVVPGMLADLVFVLGLTILLHGLQRVSDRSIYAGILVASIARQNVLVLLPGIFTWVLFSDAWAIKRPRQKFVLLGMVSALTAGIYVAIKVAVLPVTNGREYGAEIFLSLFRWAGGEAFSFRQLAEHLLRVALPLAMALVFAAGGWGFRQKSTLLRRPEFVAALLMAAAIVSQPLLADPIALGMQNQSRLSSMALVPLLVACAILLREAAAPGGAYVVALWLALGLGSFHHLYSIVGPPGASAYVCLHLIAAAMAGAVLFLFGRGSPCLPANP